MTDRRKRESELERTERLFMQSLLHRTDGAEEYLATRYRQAAQYLEPLYLDAYDSLQDAYSRGVPADQLARYLREEQRYAQMLFEASEITEAMGADYQVQLKASTQDAARLAQQSFTAQMLAEYDPDTALRAGFAAFPAEQVKMMTARLDFGSPILAGAASSNQIVDALIEGVANGVSPLVIADRIRNVLGSQYGSAVMLTRTEMLRVYRDTTSAVYQNNARYLKGWRWSSALDLRTCPICWALHGEEFPLNEKMATHPMCRCSMRPLVKAWGDVAKQLRGVERLRAPEVMGVSRFDQLSRADQRQILGPVGAEAYRQKLFTLPQLVKETYSPVWGAGRSQRSIRSLIGPTTYRNVRAKALGYQRPPTPKLPPLSPAKKPILPAPGPRRKPPTTPAPAVPPAEWSPSMPGAQANAWAMQGDLSRPLYHVTSPEGEAGIATTGFDLSRSQWGRVWGNGAYMSDSPASEKMYSSAFDDPRKLELRVFSRKTLRVDLSGKEWDGGYDAVWEALPDPEAAKETYDRNRRALDFANQKIRSDAERLYPLNWDTMSANERFAVMDARELYYEQQGYVRHSIPEALTRTLRDTYGYDALEIIDEPHRQSVGGSQVIVWDIKRVTVVKDD